MLNYLILVSGRVQGVGFRYFTWQLAKDAGLIEILMMVGLKLLLKDLQRFYANFSLPLKLVLAHMPRLPKFKLRNKI